MGTGGGPDVTSVDGDVMAKGVPWVFLGPEGTSEPELHLAAAGVGLPETRALEALAWKFRRPDGAGVIQMWASRLFRTTRFLVC